MVTTNKTAYSSANEIGMLIITEGCFMMGSEDGYEDEKPRHKVCIDSFSMAVFKVIQKKYKKIMSDNPSNFRDENLPVGGITWEEAHQ